MTGSDDRPARRAVRLATATVAAALLLGGSSAFAATPATPFNLFAMESPEPQPFTLPASNGGNRFPERLMDAGDLTGDGVRDTGCTLKAMRRPCREALVPFYGMHRFIPALIKGMGYRLVEIPVNHRPRVAGVSKYGFGNRAWKATCDMFAVKWLLSRQFQIRIRPETDHSKA